MQSHSRHAPINTKNNLEQGPAWCESFRLEWESSKLGTHKLLTPKLTESCGDAREWHKKRTSRAL